MVGGYKGSSSKGKGSHSSKQKSVWGDPWQPHSKGWSAPASTGWDNWKIAASKGEWKSPYGEGAWKAPSTKEERRPASRTPASTRPEPCSPLKKRRLEKVEKNPKEGDEAKEVMGVFKNIMDGDTVVALIRRMQMVRAMEEQAKNQLPNACNISTTLTSIMSRAHP